MYTLTLSMYTLTLSMYTLTLSLESTQIYFIASYPQSHILMVGQEGLAHLIDILVLDFVVPCFSTFLLISSSLRPLSFWASCKAPAVVRSL